MSSPLGRRLRPCLDACAQSRGRRGARRRRGAESVCLTGPFNSGTVCRPPRVSFRTVFPPARPLWVLCSAQRCHGAASWPRRAATEHAGKRTRPVRAARTLSRDVLLRSALKQGGLSTSVETVQRAAAEIPWRHHNPWAVWCRCRAAYRANLRQCARLTRPCDSTSKSVPNISARRALCARRRGALSTARPDAPHPRPHLRKTRRGARQEECGRQQRQRAKREVQ